jgi:hypothetical protein
MAAASILPVAKRLRALSGRILVALLKGVSKQLSVGFSGPAPWKREQTTP